jgi:CDP-glycerol glycerophosphotransferase
MSDDTVLFSSWYGRRWGDSPRAIAAELRRRGAPLRLQGILAEGAPAPADELEWLRPDSAETRAALESARYIVSNDVLPLEFDKRADALYVQTWHGTPLKRIGYDVADPQFPDHDHHYEVELGRDVARWDVLLSGNRYSSEILRRAFRFEGDVLETGYPRNDVLLAPDRDAVRARVRDALGLSAGARVVLYAPTWRDAFSMTLELDVEQMHAALGDAVVVLTRAHGLTAANTSWTDGPGRRDVTRWPEISQLYLAADVLLTDYSSAMFDFALTGKPQLFFTYDLEEYRDRLRGFYFCLAGEAPGPLLRTTTEVVEALASLDAVVERYRGAYERFVRRFCDLDDGRAAARVVDAVFGDVLDALGVRTR